jgi:hypothetical protein
MRGEDLINAGEVERVGWSGKTGGCERECVLCFHGIKCSSLNSRWASNNTC